MATLVLSSPGTGTYRPAGMGQVGSTLEAMTNHLLTTPAVVYYHLFFGIILPGKGSGY